MIVRKIGYWRVLAASVGYAAAVVGLSPWKRPINIVVAKTRQLPFELPTEAMWWGNYLEAGVRRRYSELARIEVAYGNSIVKLFPLSHSHGGQTIVASSQNGWRLGTPDADYYDARCAPELRLFPDSLT